MELKKAIEQRHCVRKFKDKKAKIADIISVLESALKAPCAGNIFTVRLILVDEAEKKAKLADAALNQNFVAEASHVIVVCSSKSQIELAYGNRGKAYAKQQAGAAIQNMFLRATDLGLGMCWIGAFNDDAVKRVLQIPDEVDVEAILPVGYETGKAYPRKKPELKEIVGFNRYGFKISGKKKVVT